MSTPPFAPTPSLPRWHRRDWLARMACSAAVAGVALPRGGWAQAAGQPLVIGASVSLAPALDTVIQGFQRSHPRLALRPLYGSADALLSGHRHGVGLDVLACADLHTLDGAEASGLVRSASRIAFARNELVLAVPVRGTGQDRASVTQLSDLADPRVRRVATGNPGIEALGRYALRATSAAGLAKVMQGKWRFLPTSREVVQALSQGECDAALIYRSDAQRMNGINVVATVPLQPEPTFEVAVLSDSGQVALGIAFIDHLLSPAVQSQWRQFGFAPIR